MEASGNGKLVQHNETRWNSEFEMIISVLRQDKDTLKKLNLDLTDREHTFLNFASGLFQRFRSLTVFFQGEHYPTSSDVIAQIRLTKAFLEEKRKLFTTEASGLAPSNVKVSQKQRGAELSFLLKTTAFFRDRMEPFLNSKELQIAALLHPFYKGAFFDNEMQALVVQNLKALCKKVCGHSISEEPKTPGVETSSALDEMEIFLKEANVVKGTKPTVRLIIILLLSILE